MNKMNTATVGLAVTPTVLSTFVSHVRSAAPRVRKGDEKPGNGRGKTHPAGQALDETTLLTNVTDLDSSSTASLYTNGRRLISPTTRACTSSARSYNTSPTTPSRNCRPSRPNGSRIPSGSRSTTSPSLPNSSSTPPGSSRPSWGRTASGRSEGASGGNGGNPTPGRCRLSG